MRKLIAPAAALLLAMPMGLDAQNVSYSLPQTSIAVEVEAVKESFFAGPYAKYARKYLGVDARQQDETTWQISSIRLKPLVEADQGAHYTVALPKGKGAEDIMLRLTAQGLVADGDGSLSGEGIWRFPGKASADFADKGISSNLTSESATLYQNVKRDDAYTKVSVQQSMVVEKSAESKAAETADLIFRLRKVRIQIVTGDTDASYNGEAMGSVLNELDKLEKEYMTLFLGYSDRQTQIQRLNIVPRKSEPVSVAFRVSDQDGVVSADNVTGKPYLLQIDAQEVIGQPVPDKVKDCIIYRVPAVCDVKITDGVNVLLQSRMPIYQFGAEQYYPVK